MIIYENDNELLYMIQQKDEIALGLLLIKYRTVIDCKIAEVVYDKRVFRQQRDDLRQLGYILLSECLECYNESRPVRFSTFFSFCFERKIRNQLRSYYSNNGLYVNSLSLDQTVDEFGEFTLGENIESVYPDYQADSSLNYHERLRQIKETIADFSPLEKSICSLKQGGYSYQEIVEKLACNYKKIDNTMQKFRKAMNQTLKENELY